MKPLEAHRRLQKKLGVRTVIRLYDDDDQANCGKPCAVRVGDLTFPSIRAACHHFKTGPATLHFWLHSGKAERL